LEGFRKGWWVVVVVSSHALDTRVERVAGGVFVVGGVGGRARELADDGGRQVSDPSPWRFARA